MTTDTLAPSHSSRRVSQQRPPPGTLEAMANAKPHSTITGAQDRLGLWPLRVAWFLTLPIVGAGLDGPTQQFDSPGPLLAEVCLWAAWFVGLVACLAATPIGLTVIRILTPATVALPLLAGALTGAWSTGLTSAVGFGMVVTFISYTPLVGDRMINGSAYGSERRMALRPPAFALLGPVQLAWALVAVGAVTGPILLADGRYVLGVVATILGVGAVLAGWRVLHQLARRWIVFVPAGFVIHDHVMVVESILLRRTMVTALGPASSPPEQAPAARGDRRDDETDEADGGAAVDLSGGAYGLALEVVLDEPTVFGRRESKKQVANIDADRIVFTPTLPGAVLTEARARAITIGSVDNHTV